MSAVPGDDVSKLSRGGAVALPEVWVALMCAPGVRVTLDDQKRDDVVFKNKRGNSEPAKAEKPALETTKLANPLAIPLKVPGMG